MSRRVLSLCLFLGACSTGATITSSAQAPTTLPKAEVANPVPSPVIAKPEPPKVYTSFSEWRSDFIKKAAAKGFDARFVEAQLRDVQPLESVVNADSKQPEFSKPISAYIRGAVSVGRIDNGRTRLAANPNVATIAATYGVPTAIMGAIWGMESDYGRVQGNIDVVTAFATLAFEGRRRDWAEGQLWQTLSILRDGKATRERLKGSWAGAMGQTQFLPENYLKLGVDGDNDGIVDIWTSDSDALASTANLLAKAGWQKDQAWAVEVTLPQGFDYYLSETENQTPEWWASKGVVRSDGLSWNASETLAKATLILPSGAKGPAFLALPNHYVIRKYNNSTAYALGVGFIADGILGKGPLKVAWPDEVPLSLSQRTSAQTALNQLGYNLGKVDGVIGVGTRKALREWQRANGRIADGYLSSDLANELAARITPPLSS
jgi:membrane-bound lytic murein transglycosylase B